MFPLPIGAILWTRGVTKKNACSQCAHVLATADFVPRSEALGAFKVLPTSMVTHMKLWAETSRMIGKPPSFH